MKFLNKFTFIFFRIIYSRLTDKLVSFLLIQVALQLTPLLIDPLQYPTISGKVVSTSNSDSILPTILFLAGTAWISVPSFIDGYSWKKLHTKILRFIAYLIGTVIVVFAYSAQILPVSFDEYKDGLILLTVPILLTAALYIYLCHVILLKRVSIKLLWTHQAQFSGIYCAKYAGTFEKYGLYVTIKEPNINNHSVRDFSDDFSIVSGIDVLRMLDDNQKIRSVLPIVRKNPFVVIAKRDSNINSVDDLKGKSVGIQKDFETEIYYKAFALNHGFNPKDDFVYKNLGLGNREFFESREIDVQIRYKAFQTYFLRKENVPFIEFDLAKENFPGYADTIIVRDSFLQNEKLVVRAFIDSVVQGWTFARENKEVALSFVNQLSQHNDPNFQKIFLNEMLDLIYSNTGQLGDEQSVNEWQEMLNFLVKFKVLKEDNSVNVNSMIFNL